MYRKREITTSNIDISTTILKIIDSTIQKEIETTFQTTIPSIIDEETLIIFLGCGQIIKKNLSITFSTYFINLTETAFSKELIFPLPIIYDNTSIEGINDNYPKCSLNENAKPTINYFCEVQVQNENIKRIKFKPNFNFTGQSKVSLVGITPLARMNMNNLLKIDNKFNYLLLSNMSIYIFDNSSVYTYGNNSFDISGTINEDKPKIILMNKNLSLLINIENNETEDENELINEMNCIVGDLINNNCTLVCKRTVKKIYNLQSALSINENSILIINFNNTLNENNSIIYPDSKSEAQ